MIDMKKLKWHREHRYEPAVPKKRSVGQCLFFPGLTDKESRLEIGKAGQAARTPSLRSVRRATLAFSVEQMS
jgi:hypothetical protein